MEEKIRAYVEKNIEHRFAETHEAWEREKTVFDENEANIEERENARYLSEYDQEKKEMEQIIAGDKAAVESSIEYWMSTVELPVDFNMQFDFCDNELFVDLDLPEIEDMPQEKATMLANGTTKRKNKTQKEIKADYVSCIFGLGLFFASNLFNISPCIKNIIMSGYTQRRDSKTGDIKDDYVYSIKFDRQLFENTNLKNINSSFEFCMNFENRCNITSTMLLKTIEPFGANAE